jgi:hypothetical protein
LLVTVIISGLGFRSFAHGKELEEQLEIARQVQSELLPAFTEKYAGVQLATVYTPAEQVGGDFYDVFRVKDDGIALVMGDVSGKGVPAALLMGVIHGAVRSSLWALYPSFRFTVQLGLSVYRISASLVVFPTMWKEAIAEMPQS